MKYILILLLLPSFAFAQTATDNFGRTITCINNVCTTPNGPTIQAPFASALNTYNGMAPPDWAPPTPVVAPGAAAQAKFAALIAGGLQIASTDTPSINGTYAVDPTAQSNFSSVETYALANGNFPLGTTEPWVLINGTQVTIPNITEFKALASAAAQFVAQADIAEATAAAGGTANWPSSAVTIP